ncbi:long-chain fatty alcohol dehydrogenase [Aureobasidium sp. EXF-10727]|nr:long-chain fatty alcohol dehydrogenase [Aureobasidium sp. EXF-10727]
MSNQRRTTQQTPSPLSPFQDKQILTENQWTTLASIVDTIISPETQASEEITKEAQFRAAVDTIKHHTNVTDEALLSEYLAESATSCPEFREAIYRLLAQQIHGEGRKGLLTILDALTNARTSWLLTGHLTPFAQLSLRQRERVLQSWATARLQIFRVLFRTFDDMTKAYWTRTSPTLGRILSYPYTPINHSYGPGFDFPFVVFPPLPQEAAIIPATFETDVLIIGSGCTGAVAASVLARSGLEVLVAEKGYHWKPNHLPMSEKNGMVHLFANGGVTLSDTGKMGILAGSCFGGGGTVNWSASLQLQPFVRQEFAKKHNLPYFESSAFQQDMDAVCETMGVGTQGIRHNPGNQMLLDGAQKLGMKAKPVPQNTAGEAHQCGYCTLGCGSCGKKGPTESWLPDAARHGAKFIEGFQCEKVIYAKDKTQDGRKIAIGAQGVWTSRDESGGVSGKVYRRPVTIYARRAVVVAAGALGGTALLLERSGIQNPHLGKHLKLHPVNTLFGVFDKDIMPWEGGILTSVVNEYENIDSTGYGCKLECVTMLPSMVLPLMQWKSGLEWKAHAAKFKRMAGWISLARDKGEGEVYADPEDKYRVRVKYDTSKSDQRNIAVGLVALAKIAFVEGAREIHVGVTGVPPFIRHGSVKTYSSAIDASQTGEDAGVSASINDPEFMKWLSRLELFTVNGLPGDAGQVSAHQMGTARMGSSPTNSVVNSRGAVWNTQSLYVADTSVFPGASGVNPMITGMAIARGIARGIVEDLGLGSTHQSPRAKL